MLCVCVVQDNSLKFICWFWYGFSKQQLHRMGGRDKQLQSNFYVIHSTWCDINKILTLILLHYSQCRKTAKENRWLCSQLYFWYSAKIFYFFLLSLIWTVFRIERFEQSISIIHIHCWMLTYVNTGSAYASNTLRLRRISIVVFKNKSEYSKRRPYKTNSALNPIPVYGRITVDSFDVINFNDFVFIMVWDYFGLWWVHLVTNRAWLFVWLF